MTKLMFKWFSILTLLSTIFAFYMDILPPYRKFTDHDKWWWILGLSSLMLLQVILLIYKVHHCYSYRVWSDFILQLTGLTFIILAGVFGVMYPPFTWAMGVFPTIGILYLVVGRYYSQRSRECLRACAYDGTSD